MFAAKLKERISCETKTAPPLTRHYSFLQTMPLLKQFTGPLINLIHTGNRRKVGCHIFANLHCRRSRSRWAKSCGGWGRRVEKRGGGGGGFLCFARLERGRLQCRLYLHLTNQQWSSCIHRVKADLLQGAANETFQWREQDRNRMNRDKLMSSIPLLGTIVLPNRTWRHKS